MINNDIRIHFQLVNVFFETTRNINLVTKKEYI